MTELSDPHTQTCWIFTLSVMLVNCTPLRIHQSNLERLRPAWVLRSWGLGCWAVSGCWVLMWKFPLGQHFIVGGQWVRVVLSELCQPGVTQANTELLTLFLLLNNIDSGLFVSCSRTLTQSRKSNWLTVVNSATLFESAGFTQRKDYLRSIEWGESWLRNIKQGSKKFDLVDLDFNRI